jgi:hypothetical protein
LEREERLAKLIKKFGEIYYSQPKEKRNAMAAINQTLDNAGITYLPDREWYFPRMCSALGINGGKTTAARRKQMVFTF